jgi:hypothetical protein
VKVNISIYTLAYYDTATITAVKSFIVQAPGGSKGPRHVLKLLFYEKLQNCKIDNNSTTSKTRKKCGLTLNPLNDRILLVRV